MDESIKSQLQKTENRIIRDSIKIKDWPVGIHLEQKIMKIALRTDPNIQVKKTEYLPKPKPLEEDDYYKKLEQIIARDFFPANFDS